MKVFDFTDGRKGRELANIKVANSQAGWLVRKGDKVFKVELADAPGGWSWHSAATALRWENGEPVEDMPIRPEDFGVEAICFCTGEWSVGFGQTEWQWTVLGTTEWNRAACQKGILKATFSHMMKGNEE